MHTEKNLEQRLKDEIMLELRKRVSGPAPKSQVEWVVQDYFEYFRTVETVWKSLQGQRREFLRKHIVENGAHVIDSHVLITTEPILSQKENGYYYHQERLILCDKEILEELQSLPDYSLEMSLEYFPNTIIEYQVLLSDDVVEDLEISEPLVDIRPK